MTDNIIPVFVGFGISKPEHARAIADAGADGIIIGSAIVNIVKENLEDLDKMVAKMVEFTSNIKNAVKELN